MTMKELFKKVETFNEMAKLMGANEAKIVLVDAESIFQVEGVFKTYKEFTKHVRSELQKEIADKMIKANDWEFDGEIEFDWAAGHCAYRAELASC